MVHLVERTYHFLPVATERTCVEPLWSFEQSSESDTKVMRQRYWLLFRDLKVKRASAPQVSRFFSSSLQLPIHSSLGKFLESLNLASKAATWLVVGSQQSHLSTHHYTVVYLTYPTLSQVTLQCTY